MDVLLGHDLAEPFQGRNTRCGALGIFGHGRCIQVTIGLGIQHLTSNAFERSAFGLPESLMFRLLVVMLVGGASATTTINVGMLMRLTTGGYDLGNSWQSTAAASLLAVNHFNTRNSSLIPAFGQLASCDVQLVVSPIVYDTESTMKAVASLVIQGSSNWQAIIGPARSATAVTAATLGAHLQLPQIGYWSSSVSLDNVAEFPYFGRVCPSDLATNQARMAYFKEVNWNRVGLLYINDEWGAPIASDLSAKFSEMHGWTLKPQAFTGGNVEEMRTGLMTLKNDGYKIFLYLSYEADTLLMLRAATALGLIGKDYAWTFGDVDMVESLNGADFDAEIKNAIKGAFTCCLLEPLTVCSCCPSASRFLLLPFYLSRFLSVCLFVCLFVSLALFYGAQDRKTMSQADSLTLALSIFVSACL